MTISSNSSEAFLVGNGFLISQICRNFNLLQMVLNRTLEVKVCGLLIITLLTYYFFYWSLFHIRTNKRSTVNGWQLAKMKKSIPDMSLP